MTVYCTHADVSEITGQNYRDFMLKLSGIVGTFTVGESVTGGTSGALGVVTTYASPIMQCIVSIPELAKFAKAEVVTGVSSAATGTVASLVEQTKPTLASVTSLCSRMSLEFERLCTVYGIALPLPTSDTAMLAMVKNGVCYGVAATIEAQLYLQQPQNESQRRGHFSRQWEAFIDTIKANPETFGAASQINYDFPDPDTEYNPFRVQDGEIF